MFLIADVWDALGGGALALAITALTVGYVRILRGRASVRRDDRNDVIESQRKYIAEQDARYGRLEKRMENVEKSLGDSIARERRCQRRVDRLLPVVRSHEEQLMVYEKAMREVGIPVRSVLVHETVDPDGEDDGPVPVAPPPETT